MTEYQRDLLNRVTEVNVTDTGSGEVRTRTFEYDVFGRVTARHAGSPSILTESYTYNGFGLPAQYTDSRGEVWKAQYDRAGRLRRIEHPSSATFVEHVYDGYGDIIHTNESALRHTSYKRLFDGRLVGVQVSGRSTDWWIPSYQGDILWSATIAENGTQKRSVEKVQFADPGTNVVGSASLVEDDTGSYFIRSAVAQLDFAGSPVSTTRRGNDCAIDPANCVEVSSSFDNDALGRTTGFTDPEGFTSTISINLAGWPVQRELAGTDSPRANQTVYLYDSLGRIIEETDAEANLTRYRFNGFGQQTGIDLPGGVTGTYEVETIFDSIGRVDRTIDLRDVSASPEAQAFVLVFNYLPGGDLDNVVWERPGLADTQVASWSYDAFGRTTSSVFTNVAAFELAKTFSAFSTATKADFRVERGWAYDRIGRVLDETTTVGGSARSVLSSHQATMVSNGTTRNVTYPSGALFSREFDTLGRLDAVLGGLNGLSIDTTYDYLGDILTSKSTQFQGGSANLFEQSIVPDAFGRPSTWTTSHDDSVDVLHEIDALRDIKGRIRSLNQRFDYDVKGQSYTHAQPWRGYDYGANGAILEEYRYDGSIGPLSHAAFYGSDGELTANDVATIGGGIATRFDHVRNAKIGSLGSIVSESGAVEWEATRNAQAGHRLGSVTINGNTQVVSHDHSGRATSFLDQNLYWGPMSTLVGAEKIGGATNEAEIYLYDAAGRLAARLVGDGTTEAEFVYDGEQIVAAYDASGLVWEAVWGDGIDQLVAFQDYRTGSPAAPQLPIIDHRNNIVGSYATNTGEVLQTARYSLQGRLTLYDHDPSQGPVCNEEGTNVCQNPSDMPFGFNSAMRSPRSGLLYMRNRWYSPRAGEFVSHDPLGYIDSHNPYAFAAFDPVNQWDPFGLAARGVAEWWSGLETGLSITWPISVSGSGGDGSDGDSPHVADGSAGLPTLEIPVGLCPPGANCTNRRTDAVGQVNTTPSGAKISSTRKSLLDLEPDKPLDEYPDEITIPYSLAAQLAAERAATAKEERSGILDKSGTLHVLSPDQARKGVPDGMPTTKHSPTVEKRLEILQPNLAPSDAHAGVHTHPRGSGPSLKDIVITARPRATPGSGVSVVVSKRGTWVIVRTKESRERTVAAGGWAGLAKAIRKTTAAETRLVSPDNTLLPGDVADIARATKAGVILYFAPSSSADFRRIDLGGSK